MDNEIGLTDKNPKIQGSIINDFCMTICTVNGSGSATANLTLLRSLFHMGIPVSGKNIFPSNIKGLPTWFSIRVSKDGYLARVTHDDIIVQMNPMTFEEDMKYNISGGVVFYADHIDMSIDREDVIV
jgi:2-oxoglutarate ferredoxin oxidoreductase subunit alpha